MARETRSSPWDIFIDACNQRIDQCSPDDLNELSRLNRSLYYFQIMRRYDQPIPGE